MKFKAPSLSLRSVILLAVVVGIAAPALALLAYSDAFIRRSLEPVLEGQRAAVLTLAANGLVEPLWTVDSPAVQRALDQLLSDVNVCAVELNEERVDTRVKAKETNNPSPTPHKAKRIPCRIMSDRTFLCCAPRAMRIPIS